MTVVDFPSRKCPEPLVWQCGCGSFSFWLCSNRAAVCCECHREAAGLSGLWRIKEAPVSEAPMDAADNVIPLHPAFADRELLERLLLDAAMKSPVARRLRETGKIIVSAEPCPRL